MDRKDFFYRQLVTQNEIDAAYTQVENSLWANRSDDALVGVISGLVATLGAAPTVDITAGVAITSLGKRIPAYIDSDLTKNHSYVTDTLGVATSVTAGQERWISVFAKFGRQALDSRLDGNGDTVYHNQPECLHSGIVGVLSTPGLGGAGVDHFHIVSGVSAATGLATRPALIAGEVLVADILRTPSDASNVLSTSRRQVYGIPDTTAPGTGNGLTNIMSAMTTWLGGRTNPAAASLHAAIDKIIVDLAVTTAGDDGAERIGAAAGGTLSSGSVRSQLDQLDALKAALAAASNHFTGNQVVDGSGSFGTTLHVGTDATVDGTMNVTGVTTLSARERLTPTQNVPAIDAAQIALSARLLLFEVDMTGAVSGSATASKLRLYLNNKAMFTDGPRRSLLITTNARWDGTNWNKDTGSGIHANAIELAGIRGDNGSADHIWSGGPVHYHRIFEISTPAWTDSGWIVVDTGAVLRDSLKVNFNDTDFAGGTNYFNMFTGEMQIGISLARIYHYVLRGYAGAGFTAGGVVNYCAVFASAPSHILITDTITTNCGGATTAANGQRQWEFATNVIGAGAYYLRGTIEVRL